MALNRYNLSWILCAWFSLFITWIQLILYERLYRVLNLLHASLIVSQTEVLIPHKFFWILDGIPHHQSSPSQVFSFLRISSFPLPVRIQLCPESIYVLVLDKLYSFLGCLIIYFSPLHILVFNFPLGFSLAFVFFSFKLQDLLWYHLFTNIYSV